ncbi:ficolin-2-like isoform X2 [Palaemon carinicauda]|uniref:ficolin-2-like isoform X2 n=1 Tax=Palaemon carinicauda TaxID=392227 RepID=UPI0035B58362
MENICRILQFLLVVIGCLADVIATTTVPYETSSESIVPLLASLICDKRPNLQDCLELNETLQRKSSAGERVDIIRQDSSIRLVQEYMAETEQENQRLRHREMDQGTKIVYLEGTNRQLQNKVQALEMEMLATHRKYPGIFKSLTVQSDSSREDSGYQPTAKLLRPADCADYLLVGAHKSGLYDIYPFKCRCSAPIKVWCDMETDGGGWTVILNRRYSSNPVNFTQPWEKYKTGFGNASTEYWIGNEILHTMTNTRTYSLRFDFEQTQGNSRWAEWPLFSVANEGNRYKLDVPGFQAFSMTDNCLSQHHGKYFSTYDYDNDGNTRNCAETKMSGFWYHNCATMDPTIPFNSDGELRTACTYKVNGKSVQLIGPALQLKIRPKICGELVKAVHFNTHTCEGHNS